MGGGKMNVVRLPLTLQMTCWEFDMNTQSTWISRSVAVFLLVAVLLVNAGCLLSIKSIATKKNIVTNAALEGSWECEKTKDGWTISAIEGSKQYRMTHRDPDSKISVFKGHLLKIQDKLFFEFISADEINKDANVYERWSHVPTYVITHVRSLDSALELSDVNPKWLKDYLKKNPKAIEHAVVGDRIVLTDTPEKIAAFLVQLTSEPKAITEGRKYQKLLD